MVGAPKVPHMAAQGNALGYEAPKVPHMAALGKGKTMNSALKGQHKKVPPRGQSLTKHHTPDKTHHVVPLQGTNYYHHVTQGVALSCVAPSAPFLLHTNAFSCYFDIT